MRRPVSVVLAVLAMATVCAAQEAAEPPRMSISEMLMEAERLVAAQQYAEAHPYVSAALRQDAGNVQALSLEGEILAQLNQHTLARQSFLAVREIQPNDFRANFGLGRMYVSSGVFRQALQYLKIAEPVAPPERKAELFVLLARAERGTGTASRALETVQRAIEADPLSFDAWRYATMLLVETEDFDRALLATQNLVRIAESELTKDPADRAALERLYLAYDARMAVLRSYHVRLYDRNLDGTSSDRLLPGTEKAAASMLQAMVETMVMQAELRRTMAFHEMLTLAQRTVEYDSSNTQYWAQLGLLYVNTAQFDRARAAFERAIELEPQNMQAREQLEQLPGRRAAPPPPPTAEPMPGADEEEPATEEDELPPIPPLP